MGSSCAVARFWFAPQRLATVSYGISALAGLAILLLLAAPLWRGRRALGSAREEPALAPAAPADSEWRLDWKAALAVGVGVGLASGWFFAVRAGVLLGIAAAFLTWRGATSRRCCGRRSRCSR